MTQVGGTAGEGQRTGAEAESVLSRGPYMGISCKTPNRFSCDRVGLAVWLRQPATSVEAEIAGRRLELNDPGWSAPLKNGERRAFAGFLKPAGLLEPGPLHVAADQGRNRWIGRKPVSATVNLSILQKDGLRTTTTVRVGLSAGWG